MDDLGIAIWKFLAFIDETRRFIEYVRTTMMWNTLKKVLGQLALSRSRFSLIYHLSSSSGQAYSSFKLESFYS